ncbi:MAG: hypothetical protein GF401_00035 [Chitinivibrionales bacterium]|nr:hypothetical protein [Chitinivibrionales bacterium]
MDPKTKAKVFNIVGEEIETDIDSLDPDKDLREQSCIDTMGIVRCASKIEQQFDVDLPVSIVETRTLNELLDVVYKVIEERKMKKDFEL